MVPAWLRETADRAVHDAAVDLGINPQPVIRWWQAQADAHLAGWVEDGIPGEVNLVANNMQDVYSTRARVFHELRHIWQDKNVRYIGDRKAREDDASRRARQASGYFDDVLNPWERGYNENF